jgi:pyruvate kinase
VPRAANTDELMRIIDDVLIGGGRAAEGDTVIMTAGAPPGIAGSTNNVRVHRIGDGRALPAVTG